MNILDAINYGEFDLNEHVDSYARCTCGAITLMSGNRSVSFLSKNRDMVAPGLDLRKLTRYNTYCNCNWCCNHWGLDLCACGSGLPPEECDRGLPECGTPYQKLEDIVSF